MIRAATLPNAVIAADMVRLLNEHGIDAYYTTEYAPDNVLLVAVLWLPPETDMSIAGPLLRQGPSCSWSICPSCRYDLRAHTGTVRCPECGSAVVTRAEPASEPTAAADVLCPACREPVPASFDLCWNCGGVMKG